MECNLSDRVKPVLARNAHECCSRGEELNQSHGDNYGLISGGTLARLAVTFRLFIRPPLTLTAAAVYYCLRAEGGRCEGESGGG